MILVMLKTWHYIHLIKYPETSMSIHVTLFLQNDILLDNDENIEFKITL